MADVELPWQLLHVLDEFAATAPEYVLLGQRSHEFAPK